MAESASTVQYGWIGLHRLTPVEVLARIEENRTTGRPLTASYFGFHSLNVVGSSETLRQAFRSLHFVFPDGILVLWTTRLFGPALNTENRMNGDILGPLIYREALLRGWTIYLFGSAPGIAEEAARRIGDAYRGIQIVGTRHGFQRTSEDMEETIRDINRTRPTVVLVAMDQPNQEQWIATNSGRLETSFILGVGGYFDHMARRVDCYPGWVYRFKLNWAYRLAMEPRRLWKRYTVGVLKFAYHIVAGQILRIIHGSGRTA